MFQSIIFLELLVKISRSSNAAYPRHKPQKMPGTCDDKLTIATETDSYNICGFYSTFPPAFILSEGEELNFFFSTMTGGQMTWDFDVSWEELWDEQEGVEKIEELAGHFKKVLKMVNKKNYSIKVFYRHNF